MEITGFEKKNVIILHENGIIFQTSKPNLPSKEFIKFKNWIISFNFTPNCTKIAMSRSFLRFFVLYDTPYWYGDAY